MSEKQFDIVDNFKRRYAAIIKIQQYVQKWKNTNQVRFTNREQQMLGRMISSLDRSLNKLQEEFMMLFKDEDIKCLEKYLKK